MKSKTLRNLALLLSVSLALSSCASLKVNKDPHAPFLGEWEYEVAEIPVDIDGTCVISKEEGVLKALLITPMGEANIEEITIEDNALKAEFDAGGNNVELEGTFDGNTYSGFMLVQGGQFPMKMTKTE